MPITFRPHHFLCALCFRGKGYSPDFIANFTAIMNTLNAPHGDDTFINITDHTDDICNACPERTGKTCLSQEKITRLDEAHRAALQLNVHDQLTWGDAKKIIKNKLTLAKFHEICDSCEWKKYGICEEVLKDFLS